MNPTTHTVTIPIADYQELVAALNDSNAKFIKLRDRLIKDLENMRLPDNIHLTPREFLWQLIEVIKEEQ